MNTRMQFLEHELAEQERELQRKNEPAEAAVQPESETVIQMERKIKELDALVNGLREELLDMKSQLRKVLSFMEKMGGSPAPARNSQMTPSRSGMRRSDVVAEPVTEEAPTQAVRQAIPHTAVQSQLPMQDIRRPSVKRPVEVPAEEPQPHHQISSPVPPKQKQEPEVSEDQLRPGEYEFVMQPDGTIQKRRKSKQENVIIAGTGYGPGRSSHSSAIRADSNAVIEADEDDTLELGH